MTSMATMARFRRVAQLWNWLPGFRGVAEHESVHKAAQTLGISPSALSRTVKLLESALGAPLFVRQASGLELTTLGAELLTITRDVMRQVDDCITRDEARRGGVGPLLVGVTSDLAAAVAARALIGPGEGASTTHVLRILEEAAADELLQGNVDLVVIGSCPRTPELVGERIGQAQFGIYAAHDHPFTKSGPITPELLDAASYVAASSGPQISGRTPRIACYCDSIEVARTVCESSTLLCLLPDVLVARSPSLRRLADDGEPVPLHALRRRPLPSASADTRSNELVDRLRAALG
jgi:DNA-binding transcriptional LysR family regulator